MLKEASFISHVVFFMSDVNDDSNVTLLAAVLKCHAQLLIEHVAVISCDLRNVCTFAGGGVHSSFTGIQGVVR